MQNDLISLIKARYCLQIAGDIMLDARHILEDSDGKLNDPKMSEHFRQALEGAEDAAVMLYHMIKEMEAVQ